MIGRRGWGCVIGVIVVILGRGVVGFVDVVLGGSVGNRVERG